MEMALEGLRESMGVFFWNGWTVLAGICAETCLTNVWSMGLCRYLEFNGSHFGLPPSSIHAVTGWMAILCEPWDMRTSPIVAFYLSVCTQNSFKFSKRMEFGQKISRQRPRSAMPRKTLEKSGLKLRHQIAWLIGSTATQPNPHLLICRWGFGWVAVLPIGQAIWCRRFQPGLLQGFLRHGVSLGLCLEIFFPCTILSYPGQPPSSHV